MLASIQEFAVARGLISEVAELIDFNQVNSASEYAAQLVAELLDCAQRGSVVAQCLSASCLRTSWGMPHSDLELANYLAGLAAKQNFAPAFFELALCHEAAGTKFGGSSTAIIELIEKSHFGGYLEATVHLALLEVGKECAYAGIDGAMEMMLSAAKQGHEYAALKVADWYEKIMCNEVSAAMWYTIAARRGNVVACLRLGVAYQLGQLGLRSDPLKAAEFGRLGSHASSAAQ